MRYHVLAALVAISLNYVEIGHGNEIFAIVHDIGNGRIFFTKTQLGKPDSDSKKRKRGRKQLGIRESMLIGADIRVTEANYRAKTGKFQVGNTIAGGLIGITFPKQGRGVLARIVIEDGHVIEVNLAFPETDATAIIGIPPKRPPMKIP